METSSAADGFAQSDVAGNGDHGDAAAREGGLDCDFKHAGHLLRLRNQLALMAALCKDLLRACFLKIVAANFAAGDLRGNGEHGDAAAVAIIEAVDEVQIAGAATAGAHGKLSGEMGFGSGGEGAASSWRM